MSIENENKKVLYNIIDKYNLSLEEKEELLSIISIIFSHDEFQRRMTSEFKHHGKTTLGVHILEDTLLTYILSKKYMVKKKNKKYQLALALKIAMMHDLYTLPWQNNQEAKVEGFFNKHGFRHPIEAVINSNTWYPEMFEKEEDSKVIIDGIVHHMYPLPVIGFNDSKDNEIELKNFELVKNLSNINKKILIESSNRRKIGPVSLSRSRYFEGRIMSLADKKSSFGQIENFDSAIALVTGKNKSLIK